MKVSVNWVKKFTDVDLPTDELVEKIGAQLGAVEEVVDLGKKYQGIIIAKVVSCQKHPNADKLSVCLVNDARAVKDVKRNKDGYVEVVCGAPNVAAGQMVAWLPPGVVVPNTFDKEKFVLEAREIRGVVSNGMIASARELALGDDHNGILVLDGDVKPGQSFAKAYGLDDYIIDIENKMFTHRPDLFGMLGIARELAGIQRQPFKSPSWYKEEITPLSDGRKNVLRLQVKNGLPKLVPRFCAVAIKDVKVAPSPLWLQTYLVRVGVRPINNIVDLTNYYMLLTAQPLHAYDYDKLKTGILGVRMSKKGESLQLIGNKTVKLEHEAIVITDGDKPIGLGGVMGGASTEVDSSTKNIVLEVANFDMNATRRTAMAYGLFTDAATRFTKNQSPLQNRAVIAKALDDITRIAGGRMASPLIDDNRVGHITRSLKVDKQFINQRLGISLSGSEMKRLLENVEFGVSLQGDVLKITIPFWRTDIAIPEDIVEEVGRLYGYDHLSLSLPTRSIAPAKLDAELSFKSKVRDFLAAAGANEVLTYSFVHGSLLQKAGQNPGDSYHIKNALSPDLQYYRQSLLPSLLDKIHPNIKAGYDEFALFEMGRTHVRGLLDQEKLPEEFRRLAFVFARKSPLAGAPYYHARWFLDGLMLKLGISDLDYEPLHGIKLSKEGIAAAAPYEPNRSAVVKAGQEVIGLVGEPRASLKLGLKLPSYTSMFELDMETVQQLAGSKPYVPLNRYPSTEQDITLKIGQDMSVQQLDVYLAMLLDEQHDQNGYKYDLSVIDVFQKPNDKQHKQITWHIILEHPERTLTTAEANDLFDKLSVAASKKFKAERI